MEIAVAAALLGAAVGAAIAYAVFRLRAARAAQAQEAVVEVDPITGMPGAAELRDDVATFLAERLDGERRTLLLLDPVGFKRYNDAFGFACGDALLRRLSTRLKAAVRDRGQAYRLRGAQFAVLAPGSDAARLRAAAADALLETDEGFMVRAATGSVQLPDVASDVSQALKLADQEIQAQRATLRSHGLDDMTASGYRSRTRGGTSPYDVVDLAIAVGQRLGMGGTELDDLECAAALRDVGTIALPVDIAQATGELSDEDRYYAQLHTLAGERLLRSNFRMEGVADVIRSCHERWDGEGYPDGMARERIPLAARVVSACSAIERATSDRPNGTALSGSEAVRRIELDAGTVFDPAVVNALAAVLSDRSSAISPF
jgi:diguanylate cyclase (GGDEF)-like protein